MNPIYKFCINRATVNLLDPTMVRQGLLSTNTGILDESNNTYSSSDYIPVTPGTNYKLCDKTNFTALAPAACCYYTEDKVFISGQYGMSVAPANAAYLRVSAQGVADYGIFASTVTAWSDFVSPRVYPIYKADLAKEYNKEQNEQFYRATLEGKLTFQRDDYAWILAQAFDFEYIITLYISYDAGYSWDEYWTGNFWKTDCEFNEDSQTVIVQPTVKDQYTNVLAGIEKEFNLIDLTPEIALVMADKRPMVQVYVPGQSVIGCFLSGMWWEQECEPESDENKLSEAGNGKLNFALNKTMTIAEVSGSMTPQLPNIFSKEFLGTDRFNPQAQGTQEFTASGYKLAYSYTASSGGSQFSWTIVRVSDNVSLWRYTVQNQVPPMLPVEITLTPISGSGATGNVTLFIHDLPVYSRLVCDTQTIVTGGQTLNTYEIPVEDIVPNNRNYHYVIRYNFPETIVFSTDLVTTPTQWGIYQPGQYYFNPADNPILGLGEAFPVARDSWVFVSVWFVFSAIDWLVESSARKQFTIKDVYPLSSVISVLLSKIAPEITHEPVEEYSEFLYGETPIGIEQTLLITPKSNIISSGYDQPAQKAPITLKSVLDMLRDCFRCYWFIDDQNRFRIEHIQYFRNGGSYSDEPVVGVDLTEQEVTRSGKKWAFARSQYKFDKPGMAARYQFGWMDDVTQLFEGYPIDIISKYVNPDSIEQINISQFTSDIDYILLNPNEISKDGFVLMAGIEGNSGEYTLPYYNFQINGTDHYLQNAYVAFCFLQRYYAYDMPALRYRIKDTDIEALGIKKLKTQDIRFPLLHDIDLNQLIKTTLGEGVIDKLSINLSSRNANATLKYDTE